MSATYQTRMSLYFSKLILVKIVKLNKKNFFLLPPPTKLYIYLCSVYSLQLNYTMKLQKLTLTLLTALFIACSDSDNDSMPAPIPDGEALEITTQVTADENGKFITDVCVKGNNIVIDWGDGKRETVSSEEHTTDFLHQYAKSGTYTIKIEKAPIRELIIGNAMGTLSSELTVSACPSLEKLEITILSNLRSFAVTNCPKLSVFKAAVCPKLTELNLSGVSTLKHLECLDCKRLASLNLNTQSQLTYLQCSETNIKDLNLSNNPLIERLILAQTPITSIDLSRQTELEILQLIQTQLTDIDLSHNEILSDLVCITNPIDELDLSHCPLLRKLNCTNCGLSALDVSANTQLYILACPENELTALDLSNNKELIGLQCRHNLLTELTLNNNKEINLLDCGENKMERDALETLFDTLPDFTSKAVKGDLTPPRPQRLIAIQGNPGAERCAKQIFEKKGWEEVQNLGNYIQ